MIVMKFGGTSVGSPVRMREVADLINDAAPKIVVLSAVAGTTNQLVTLAQYLYQGDTGQAAAALEQLKAEYATFIEELLPGVPYQKEGMHALEEAIRVLEQQFVSDFGAREERTMLAQGELLSTRLFHLYLSAQGISSVLLPALGFMRTGVDGEPDLQWMRERLQWLLEQHQNAGLFITQGYICRNESGEIDNLRRGGSDYSATLIGAAVRATEIQIWTDIDGLHNADPRLVENTQPLRRVSYREAAELAYFGAKILHPTCVIPAEEEHVPVRLKNTFKPEAPGTLIAEQSSGRTVAALAAKDGIIAIRIRSARMLNAYGFLRRVFEIFEQHRTPIDMITTSEVSVSVTVDRADHLPSILNALQEYADVQVDEGLTILSVVGDGLYEKEGIAHRIFAGVEGIPLRMVSYGGSSNNISLLIPTAHKKQAMQRLHKALFYHQAVEVL